MIVTLMEGVLMRPDRAQVIEVQPGDFLDMLADEENAPSLPCTTEDEKRAGGGFILAQYRAGAASKQLSELHPHSQTEILCFDIDKMTEVEIAQALPEWFARDCCLYTTFKHRTAAPRYRLLVRMAKPVRNAQNEYLPVYMATAALLQIKADPSTTDPARLFFGPQHHPDYADERERYRFTGKPVDLSELQLQAVATSARSTEEQHWQPESGNRPKKSDLGKLAKRCSKSSQERLQKLGAVLEAVLRGESFAPEGSRHNAQAQLAFELVREWRRLDAAWFADEYLLPIWEGAWQAEQPRTRTDWLDCVASSQKKMLENELQRLQQKEELAPVTQVLPADGLQLVKAHAGRLVCSHRTSYYVYDVADRCYKGPYRGAEVSTAFRDCLGAVPGVTELLIQPNGASSLKSSVQLCYEYGTNVDNVYYYAKLNGRPDYLEEHCAICMSAYRWNTFAPVRHGIVDELLLALAGQHLPLLQQYLSQFTNLEQPLPALTLVGPRGTWKSRLCMTLSRFWGNPDVPTPSMAQQVLVRFSGPLLHNPVVWSDEELATDGGKRLAERYRSSISERVHSVERKGAEVVSLYSALRHVISVNDAAKVFSHEVDAQSIDATMERFLVLEIDGDAVQAFETKWAGTPELEALREGTPILEHVTWIAANNSFVRQGRLFVKTDTDAELLLRARFADETLFYCWALALESLRLEAKASQPGQAGRCALYCEADGTLRLNPTLVQAQWNASPMMARTGLKAPSVQRIGILLAKSGFKLHQKERASNHKSGGWQVNCATLRQFLDAEDLMSWAEMASLVEVIYKVDAGMIGG